MARKSFTITSSREILRWLTNSSHQSMICCFGAYVKMYQCGHPARAFSDRLRDPCTAGVSNKLKAIGAVDYPRSSLSTEHFHRIVTWSLRMWFGCPRLNSCYIISIHLAVSILLGNFEDNIRYIHFNLLEAMGPLQLLVQG